MKNAGISISFEKLFKQKHLLPITFLGGSPRERHLLAGLREPVRSGMRPPFLTFRVWLPEACHKSDGLANSHSESRSFVL